MTLRWGCRNKIDTNHGNSVSSGLSSHCLLLDRLRGLLIQGSAFFTGFSQGGLRYNIKWKS